MFYLGSIAGILPYLLAFSLTIVLGSHAGIPFIKSTLCPTSPKEIVKEEIDTTIEIETYSINNQIIEKEYPKIFAHFSLIPRIGNFYPAGLPIVFDAGISLLRAPPVHI
jgi:hypothetical protein